MKTYVLVEVTYDHYRFQVNIAANDDASIFNKEFINNLPRFKKPDYPIYDYKQYSPEMGKADDSEQRHYWIQEIEYT